MKPRKYKFPIVAAAECAFDDGMEWSMKASTGVLAFGNTDGFTDVIVEGIDVEVVEDAVGVVVVVVLVGVVIGVGVAGDVVVIIVERRS